MKNNPSVLDHSRFLIASVLCALLDSSRRWGFSSSKAQRLIAFSPFGVVSVFAVFTHSEVFFVIVCFAMLITALMTTARDELGIFLAGKLHGCLQNLEDSARNAVHKYSNPAFVETIQISKIDFTSPVLPIVLPPPRRIA